MDVIFSLVLIALGGLAAQEFLNLKFKPVGNLVNKIEPYEAGLGISGIIFGFIWLMVTLSYLRHFTYYPLQTLIFLGYSLLLMALGLIFGYDLTSTIIGTPSPKFVLKVGEWRNQLLPHRTTLGFAGIILGILLIVYKL